VSGGGPYAAACGYALPDRVTAVGLVCAAGPFWDVPEVDATATDEAGRWIRELIDLARVDPSSAAAHARDECARDADMCGRDPEEFVAFWFDGEGVPSPDRALLETPELREHAKDQVREALRAGVGGYTQDELIITVRPWGFRVDEIGGAGPPVAWRARHIGAHSECALRRACYPELLTAILPGRGALAHLSPFRGDRANAGRDCLLGAGSDGAHAILHHWPQAASGIREAAADTAR